MAKLVLSLISKELGKILKAEAKEQEKEVKNTVSVTAIVQAELAKIAAADAAPPESVPAISLQSILKNAKNAAKCN